MTSESVAVTAPDPIEAPTETTAEVQFNTSLEELEAFHIIRAILRDLVSPRRIFIRDAQSYCAILLDDNNRKPLCRLRFNNLQKLRIGFFNDKREEVQKPLDGIDDIYGFTDLLKATLASYLSDQEAPAKQ